MPQNLLNLQVFILGLLVVLPTGPCQQFASTRRPDRGNLFQAASLTELGQTRMGDASKRLPSRISLRSGPSDRALKQQS